MNIKTKPLLALFTAGVILFHPLLSMNLIDTPSATEAHLRTLYPNFSGALIDLVNHHLQILENRKNMKNFITPEINNLVHEVIHAEEENRDKIVFYHAMPYRVAVLMDILSEFRSLLTGDLSISYRWDSHFKDEKIGNWQRFFIDTYNQQGGWGRFKDQVLSANIFLFGNDNNQAEDTFNYWVANRGAWNPDFEYLLGPVFDDLGIPRKYISSYNELYSALEKIIAPCGRLLQILVPQPQAENVCFIYQIRAGGTTHYKSPFPVARIKEGQSTTGDPNLGTISNQDLYVSQDHKVFHEFFTMETNPVPILYAIRSNPRNFENLLSDYKNFFLNYIQLSSAPEESSIKQSLVALISRFKSNINLLQGRVFFKPELVNDPNLMNINYYWSSHVSADQMRDYKVAIRNLVMEHLHIAIHRPSEERVSGPKQDKKKQLGKLGIEPSPYTLTNRDYKSIYESIKADDKEKFKEIFEDPRLKNYIFDRVIYKEARDITKETLISRQKPRYLTTIGLAIKYKAYNILSYLITMLFNENILSDKALEDSIIQILAASDFSPNDRLFNQIMTYEVINMYTSDINKEYPQRGPHTFIRSDSVRKGFYKRLLERAIALNKRTSELLRAYMAFYNRDELFSYIFKTNTLQVLKDFGWKNYKINLDKIFWILDHDLPDLPDLNNVISNLNRFLNCENPVKQGSTKDAVDFKIDQYEKNINSLLKLGKITEQTAKSSIEQVTSCCNNYLSSQKQTERQKGGSLIFSDED